MARETAPVVFYSTCNNMLHEATAVGELASAEGSLKLLPERK
jgi:hypothetical protein